MNHSKKLKMRLRKNAIDHMVWEITKNQNAKTAFIFDDLKSNFIDKSFNEIMSHPEWSERLEKKHTSFTNETKELQSSNSSDALLMNIFCYPKILEWEGIRGLLDLKVGDEIEFGWDPKIDHQSRGHNTEVDMKIGDKIFEAKLTESDFKTTKPNKLAKYKDLNKIIDLSKLRIGNDISNYQLIRNIYAAYKHKYTFYLLLDESRTDLIRAFYQTKNAILNQGLRNKIRFITWQELIGFCGKELIVFIEQKYF